MAREFPLILPVARRGLSFVTLGRRQAASVNLFLHQ